MSTICPTPKPCGALVVIVTVVPDSVALEMLAVANDLLIVGGPTTFSVAVLLVVPVPPLLELTAPVVLFFAPPLVPVTVTLNWQVLLPPVPIDAPLRLITPVELVVVSVPLQVVALESATVNPAGRLSVNPTPVRVVAEFGLVIVNVSSEVLP